MAGFPASYFCIKAFSETDLTEDLKQIDVPTLVLHGDDDQIVPIADSALLSSKIIKNATLKVVRGRPARHVHHAEGPASTTICSRSSKAERLHIGRQLHKGGG